MKVYYWSPHLSKVATVKSVFNSCKSLNKKRGYRAKIINVIGEWDSIDKNIGLIYLENLKFINTCQKKDIFSRLQVYLIFLICFFLFFFLRRITRFLIIHLYV